MGLVSGMNSLLRVIDRLVPKERELETRHPWDSAPTLGFGEKRLSSFKEVHSLYERKGNISV